MLKLCAKKTPKDAKDGNKSKKKQKVHRVAKESESSGSYSESDEWVNAVKNKDRKAVKCKMPHVTCFLLNMQQTYNLTMAL